MKEQKNINIDFFKVDEDALPFVEITFMGMDSKMHTALMLMDSGSSVNTLMTEMRVLISESDWLPEESDEVVTVTNEATRVPCGKFQFELDGESFQEKFYFFENQHLMQIDDMMFVGVLGNRFMQKYRLAIDYSKMSIHTSTIKLETLRAGKCKFIIPLEYGLKNYNAPILNLNGSEYNPIVVADTGCDDLTISKKAIEDNNLSYQLTGRVLPIVGPNGSFEANECILDFSFTTHFDNDFNKQSYQETAEILPYSLNVTDEGECDEDGKLLSPIDGMIGSPFMARHKWVLDFGGKVIYRL